MQHPRKLPNVTMVVERSFPTIPLILVPLGLSLVFALHCSAWMLQMKSVQDASGVSVLYKAEENLMDDPQIVWLASFPNSGTSYTMTMVEQASNRSTATNYGLEVADYKNPSIPLHTNHPEGPYWEGGQKRLLPESGYILTKTHCGGRCVRCGAKDYVVNASAFLDACARTTARLGKNRRTLDNRMDPKRVAKVVHLLRNPFTNIVARFHLESRNLFRREQRTGQWLPKNATGFANFCKILDEFYAQEEEGVLDPDIRGLMAHVPCRGEFYKWTSWHNLLGQVLPSMGVEATIPVLTLYYEDYHKDLNETAGRVLEFLNLEPRNLPYRSFRELPSYADHFTIEQRMAAWRLMEAVATPWTWERIVRYRSAESF